MRRVGCKQDRERKINLGESGEMIPLLMETVEPGRQWRALASSSKLDRIVKATERSGLRSSQTRKNLVKAQTTKERRCMRKLNLVLEFPCATPWSQADNASLILNAINAPLM